MIQHAVILAFAIWGIYISFDDKMIFAGLRKYIYKLPEKATMPLIDCPKCMPSFWGTIYFFIFMPDYGLIYWPLLVLTTSGINAVVLSFLNVQHTKPPEE